MDLTALGIHVFTPQTSSLVLSSSDLLTTSDLWLTNDYNILIVHVNYTFISVTGSSALLLPSPWSQPVHHASTTTFIINANLSDQCNTEPSSVGFLKASFSTGFQLGSTCHHTHESCSGVGLTSHFFTLSPSFCDHFKWLHDFQWWNMRAYGAWQGRLVRPSHKWHQL